MNMQNNCKLCFRRNENKCNMQTKCKNNAYARVPARRIYFACSCVAYMLHFAFMLHFDKITFCNYVAFSLIFATMAQPMGLDILNPKSGAWSLKSEAWHRDLLGVRVFCTPWPERWLGFGLWKLGFEDLAGGPARRSTGKGVEGANIWHRGSTDFFAHVGYVLAHLV